MNIGTIVTPNIKGQIVIPKKIRDDLNITKNTALNIVDDGKTIYIHPVKEITTASESNNSQLLKVLKETQGTWANADWDAYDRMEKRRRKIELAAAKRNKKAW